ncbi:PREDICTED: uncharacterized protein LOC109181160 [Ipomoea nil]|uniref:uncharacterized protein LOC109181160 n=1 Tax=Ipomoea nil TaxID=35883 RepID=UPI000901D872|nr:PREDICTED: uncharacterized protein LOC109181160 [Ipomoea nil]
MEFAGTKRRSIRKLQNEPKESSKAQKDAKPDNIAANSSLFCLGSPSTLARSSKGSPRFGGNGDAPRSPSAEVSRRSTYTNWKSSLENECPKPSIPINELNISYRESLTRFMEGLGPTAIRVANRKLQALEANNAPVIQTPSFQVPTAYATFQMPSISSAAPASDQTLPDSLTGFGPPMNLPIIAEEANKQKSSNKTAPGSVVQYKRNTRKASEAEKRAQNRGKICEKQPEDAASKKMSSNSKQQPAGSSVIVDTRKPDDSKFRPIVLALEQSSHANPPPELKTRNRRSTNSNNPSTFPPKSHNKSTPATPSCKADKGGSSSKAALQPPPETQPTPPSLPLLSGSAFMFNMPFLKAQLNQMNNPSGSAAAHTWDTTPRIAPTDYLRFGSVSSSALNLAPHLDEHQQIPPPPRPCLYGNNTTANNAQSSSWQSLDPPLDSDLSLHLYK